jgi:hypothetical protein
MMSVGKRNIEDQLAANAAEPEDNTPADDKPEPDPQEQPTEDDVAKKQIEDTPDEQQFEIKDTPQGGVSVPAGETEDPNASIEERQAKKQEEVTKAIQSVRDLLLSTGPSPEAGLAIMKLDEAEMWAGKAVFA